MDIPQHKAPTKRNESARLKIGNFQTAIKSVTDLTKSRSKKFPSAPLAISTLPKNSHWFWNPFFPIYQKNHAKTAREKTIWAPLGIGTENAIPVLKVREREKILGMRTSGAISIFDATAFETRSMLKKKNPRREKRIQECTEK